MKRKGIGKKIRFEVFERDNFICQYCGKSPTDDGVVLHVDHVVSVKNGGENNIENLLTSCFDCNIGKGSKTTIKKGNTPKEIQEQLDRTKERLEQVVAMNTAMKRLTNLNRELEEEMYSWVPYILGKNYNETVYTMIKKVLASKKYLETSTENKRSAVEILSKKMQKFSTVEDVEKYLKGIMKNINLSDEESNVLMAWTFALKSRGAHLHPATRKMILDHSWWGEEYHSALVNRLDKDIEKYRGVILNAHKNAIPYTHHDTYKFYGTGENLNYLACDLIAVKSEDNESTYGEE